MFKRLLYDFWSLTFSYIALLHVLAFDYCSLIISFGYSILSTVYSPVFTLISFFPLVCDIIRYTKQMNYLFILIVNIKTKGACY